MKKVTAFLLVLILLLGILATAVAETPVEKAERLLTSYTWEGSRESYLQRSYDIYPNFCWVNSINLRDSSGFVLTGDETGRVYLVNFSQELGTPCAGEITFSADEKTMLIVVASGDLYGVFTYTRK